MTHSPPDAALSPDQDTLTALLSEKGVRIPPQPAVITQLERMLRYDTCDVRSVTGVIAQDVGLASVLFRVASSGHFYRSHPPESLEQVVVQLGMRQVMNLVRAVSLTSTLGNPAHPAFRLFWTRSREVALLASLIAEERVAVCNVFPDQAYLAGIFYECGIPVLMQRFPDYCESLILNGRFDIPSLREEDRRFNVDHCNIGYLVARHWKLPEFIAQAILHQEDIPKEESGAARTVVSILQLAQHAHGIFHGHAHMAWFRTYTDVLTELGLDPDGLSEYLDDLYEKYNEQKCLEEVTL
jgi:HD-like signal output (HDOD) protein